MNIVQKTLLESFNQVKLNNKGWHTFNAPCCVMNGESRDDTRHRGNLLFDNNDISYNCFNCKFSFVWKYESGYFSKKLKEFLSYIDYNKDEIEILEQEYKKEKFNGNVEGVKFEKKNITYNLPKDVILIKYSLLNKEQHKNFKEVFNYIIKRNKLYLLEALYWSKSVAGVIIPCYKFDKVVGYIIRQINNKIKYIKKIPNDYIFNEEILNKDYIKNVFVFEGVFDAIIGNGISILGNNITENVAKRLKQYNKKFILVLDRDEAGRKLYESFKKHNIKCLVTFPNWKHNIKDFDESVKEYGLYNAILKLKEKILDVDYQIEAELNNWIK